MNIRTTVLAALIFVALYNLLFFHTQPGLGTGLLFLFLNLYFFSVKDSRAKNILAAAVNCTVATIFAFLFSLRANGVVQFIDITAAIFFSLTGLYFLKYQGNLIWAAQYFFRLPFITFGSCVSGFFRLFHKDNWSDNSLDHYGTKSLIRGLLITIPIFLVLLLLLRSADPVFNKFSQNIFSSMGERIIESLVIFLGLLGCGLATIEAKEYVKEDKQVEGKLHELLVMTGSVIVLFAAFILVQFRYLFSSVGERELIQLGISSLTYSEYVRKGFFELLIASTVTYSLLLYVLRYLERLPGRLRSVVYLFSGILTVETGFLLLSAGKRLALYADAHGLTRARIFGFIFLIWLGLLLIIFLIRLLAKIKQQWFLASTATVTLFVLILTNIVNIDGMIATLYKPTVNGEIDYYYLTSLSDDASDSWPSALEDAREIIGRLEGSPAISPEQNRQLFYRRLSLSRLRDKISYLVRKYGTKDEMADWEAKDHTFERSKLMERNWQSFNVSEYLSYKKISANLGYYEQVLILLDRISAVESRVSKEIINNTPLDRSIRPPLVH